MMNHWKKLNAAWILASACIMCGCSEPKPATSTPEPDQEEIDRGIQESMERGGIPQDQLDRYRDSQEGGGQ